VAGSFWAAYILLGARVDVPFRPAHDYINEVSGKIDESLDETLGDSLLERT